MATLPNPNPLTNNAVASYQYFVDPTATVPNTGGNISNDVSTFINVADPQITKSVDKAYADIGQKLNYTIVIRNLGNTSANNMVLIDTTPNGTTFDADSITLNFVQQTGAVIDPPTGFTVGTLSAGQVATVSWSVTVVTMPSPNPIPNSATNNFSYIVDPSVPVIESSSTNSNIVNTQVNRAEINSDNIIKTATPTSGKVGDTIVYAITFKNTGNVTANNVVFTDTIPNNTAFQNNSVTINGVGQPGFNPSPPGGITIGTLAPGAVATIRFNVTLTTLPTVNPIPNQGKVAYTYTTDPSSPNGQSGAILSNIANVYTNQAVIDNTNGGGMVKYVNKNFAQVGDILTYTIALGNTGNVTANNVILTDTIPNGTTFVTDSLFINGTQQLGANPSPPGGVNVGSISPSAVTTVEFQVVVNTIPSPNPIPNNSSVRFAYTIDPSVPDGATGAGNSNQVTTKVNQATIDNTNGGGLTKGVDKKYAKVGDVLLYTITLRNTGNVTANNVTFTDTIPNDTTFVTNSVYVNSVQQVGASPAPPGGVNVGSIGPSASTILTFNVVVNTIPNPNPIPNSGTVNYTFTIDPAITDGGSASGNTNIVSTQVNQATIDNNNGGGMVKTVDKAFAKVGDILTYTVSLGNTGNVSANNVIFTDTIPSGTTFVGNSVYVNGTQQSGANPSPPGGVNVGSIIPGGTTTIRFQVIVNTIPTVNPIPNNSSVRYNFTIDPSVPNGGSASGNSNQVTTQINQATIDNSNGGGMVKSVDKAYANVGETITYTITLKNTGNVAATNVVFTDTIPNGTSFISGTVTVDGITPPGNPDPQTGVNIGTINAGSASTVRFQVTVITIPSPNPTPNNSTVNYNYTLDPALPDGASASGNSNQVTTQVNNANFSNGSGGIVKSVDKANAKVGDVLNYTITLQNLGNVTANNVVFTDTIPQGTTFVNNSVKVNGTTQGGANPTPPTGITIGTIAPAGTVNIQFQVVISSNPPVNPIPNQGKVGYTYTVNPASPNGVSGADLSNFVYTQMNQAVIDNTNGGGMVKSVNTAYAAVGDILTYTIALGNTGNVTATNVILTDTIPSGTTFVANSVYVNGTQQTGASPAPPLGVNVGSIGPSTITTLVFQVVVNTIPSPNPIPNNSTVNYKYTIDPAFPDGGSGSGNSNQVTTQVNQAIIDNTTGSGLIKTVTPKFGKVGDTIQYFITMKNTGNVTADNVTLTDTIPNNTTFIPNSLFVNNILQPGANPAPPTGVNVGSIGPGRATTVTFKVTVDTIPSPNPIPNTATAVFRFTVNPSQPDGASASGNTNFVDTQINDAIIASSGVVKTVSSNYAAVGDILTYTIAVTNSGNVTANSVVFKDTIPTGTTFVANSFRINQVVQSGANPNPPTGVTIGTIAPGTTVTLDFKVVVNTIPNPNPIPNSGNITYTYTIDPSVPNGGSGSGNSNIVNTQVNQGTIDNKNGGGLVKSVDKAYADVGDTLTYRIRMTNTGNVAVDNIVLTDTIPSGTSLVTDTITLDGVNLGPVNPQSGINIGTINPGQTSTLQFQVVVNTIPTPNPIPNSATLKYDFTTDPAFPNGRSSSGNSNIVNTQINSGNFDNAPGGISKTVDKAFAKVGDILNYTINLTNTGNVTSNNIVVTDTIPSGTTFVTNSVRLNGVLQPGANPAPPTGVTVATLAPGASASIAFQVTVNTIPTVNPIPNQGKAAYTYTVDPAFPNGKAAQNLTNIANTQVNQATIDNTNGGGLVKSTDKAFAKVGDTITYIINMTNTGNVTADNVIFTDTIPNGTSFVTNSVYVNGVNQPGANPTPPTGVNVGSIAPATTSSIQFQVVVNTIPSPNPIPNNGTVKFNYTLDPSVPDGGSGSGNTNTVRTQVNTASIDNNGVGGNGLDKTVSPNPASVGDTLLYTVTLKNTGNVAATNVVMTDTIPNGTTFVPNSVKVNNISQPGADPQAGIPIGTLNPGQSSVVTFNVLVGQTIPDPNPIPNTANVTYNYTIDPSIPNGGSGTGASNIAFDTINSAIINNQTGGGLVKSVSKTVASVNDILLYTINVGNTGNVTANNVVVFDTIPTGTNFVLNSVKVNGVSQPAVNPQNGVSTGNIAPGSSVQVTFNVQVKATIPNPNPIPNDSRVTYTFTTNPSVPNGRSGGGISNLVNTQINSAVIDNTTGGLIKTGTKSYADIGDTIQYFLTLKNTGNVAANNVIITDTIPNGTDFVNDSVTLNGTPQPGAVIAPPTGYTISALNPGEVATVSFKVVVTTIPSPNPIRNTATVNYVYTQDPSVPNGASGSGNSNFFNTQVNNGGLDPNKGGFTKTPSQEYAKVGDTITYTSVLKNTGNVTINNVMFYDTIPSGTTFIQNSVYLNGTQQLGANPQAGVNVGTLAPAQVATILFSVLVITIPSPNPIPNTARATYNYTVDPSLPNGANGSNNSNTSNTQINQAIIDDRNGGGLVKTVDKAYAEVGDTLNYTFTMKNTGNIAANSVVLKDTVPNGTAFTTGNAFVNNVPVSITSPTSGIPVGTINPGQLVTVTFQVSVVSFPSPNPIPNSGTAFYNFVVNPTTGATANGVGNSNIALTQVNEAMIDFKDGGGFVKLVDKPYADLGDTLVYTIRVKNTGNVSANNVVVTDTIPNGTVFSTGTVFINSILQPSSANPESGISLGSILPNGVSTIQFSVVVTTIPSPNPIPNSATANYTFTIDPLNPNGVSRGGNTNIVNTQVNNGGFNPATGGIVKSVDKAYAKVGDTLQYTTVLTNTGTVNATNVVFIDTIPSGTALVPNSVFVNSLQQPGANPQSGVSLGTLAPGIQTTVIFSVVVNTLPSTNPIPNISNVTYGYVVDPVSQPNGKRGSNLSNVVNTQINDPFINPANGGLVKTASKAFATIGDTITYTVSVKNTGNVAATNVVLQDTIPVGTTFITDTVFVNGVQQPGVNPQNGVNLPQLLPGQSASMTFNVLVTTLPLVNPIPNLALLSYNFTVDPSVPSGGSSSVPSNTTLTQINAAIIDNKVGGGLTKGVDLAYADIGYVLTYTIGVKNTGNVTATSVIINDTIPSGTVFVGNSVFVNSVNQPGVNPQAGVNLGTIGPNAASTIIFKVTVNTLPSPNPIPNTALSTYSFIVNPSIPSPTTFKGASNTVTTQVNNGTIDFNKGGGFTKSVDKNVAKVGDTVTYTLNLKNTGNTTVNNVVVTDTVPNGSTYVSGSATVNGLPVSIINPVNGIPVGSIGPSQSSTVVFSVLITQVPSPNPMINTASVKYNYTVNPANPNGATGGGNSNPVSTGLNQAIIDNLSGGFTKTASKAYADIGDIILYTITAKNTGTTTATNLIITDTIPNGTAFVNGTVNVNGTPQGSENPQSGVNVGSLGPNQVTVMTFQVIVTSIPVPNPIPNAATNSFNYTLDPNNPNGAIGTGNTNIVYTQVNHGEISNGGGGLVKSVSTPCAGVGDVITYSILVQNTGNATVNNVVISDTIPKATSFVPNSVRVNGAQYSGINPQTGINLNSIPPSGVVTVTFDVTVVSIPTSSNTSNTAIARYSYTVIPTIPNGVTAANSSNTVVTDINSAIIKGSSFTKAVSKAYADLGDTLTYTLTLTNTGNANALTVTIYDTLPNGTSFIPGTVTINSSTQGSADPQSGIVVGTVTPGSTVVVTYKALITTLGIPTPNPLPNSADVAYCYETCSGVTVAIRASSDLG